MSAGPELNHVSWEKTLRRLCGARQMEMSALMEDLNLDPHRLLSNLRKTSGPNISDLKLICDYFEITVDSFLTGFIDMDWVSKPGLPAKYSFSAGSKLRTTLPVLEYARSQGGDPFFKSLVRALKIPEALLQNPDYLVSIALLSDALAFMASRGFEKQHFVQMGLTAALIEENAEIGHEFRGLCPNQVFEKLFEESILLYEKNFDYHIIRSSSSEVRVRVTAKAERIEAFGTNRIDNYYVSYYRQGACAAHLLHAGHDPATTELHRSVHLGDPYEEFTLRWN